MTKREREELRQADRQFAYNQGLNAGKAEAKQEFAKEQKKILADANLKLASALGQMVEAVSHAVIAFTSDNGTLR